MSEQDSDGQVWEVSFRVRAPSGATWEQTTEWARYNVGENGVLHQPMCDWEWDPISFSVSVREA